MSSNQEIFAPRYRPHLLDKEARANSELSPIGNRSWIKCAEDAALFPRRLAFHLLEPGREGRILYSRRVPPSLVQFAAVLSSTLGVMI